MSQNKKKGNKNKNKKKRNNKKKVNNNGNGQQQQQQGNKISSKEGKEGKEQGNQPGQWSWPWKPEEEKLWGHFITSRYGQLTDLDRRLHGMLMGKQGGKFNLKNDKYAKAMQRRMMMAPVDEGKQQQQQQQ
jgi:hypothetical protein